MINFEGDSEGLLSDRKVFGEAIIRTRVPKLLSFPIPCRCSLVSWKAGC